MVRTIMLSLLSALSLNVYAQDSNGSRFGLGASFQTNQLDILFPLRLSEKISVLPSLSFIAVEDVGNDFGITASIRYYFNRSLVSPYFSGKAGMLMNKVKGSSAQTDWIAGLSAGGECFINKSLSLGIDAQINYSKSDKGSSRFGNPGGYTVNTATTILGIIYF